MKRRFRTPYVEPSINLTPLIDVVFVILIVFLVAAPLLDLEEVDIAQAAPHSLDKSKPVQSNSPVTVYVRKDDSIWFQDKQRDKEDLREALAEAHLRYPSVTPQLVQDRRSQFGTYQEVKNAFETAGYSELELILRPGG